MVISGDEGVGKRTLCKNFFRKLYNLEPKLNSGVDFVIKNIEIDEEDVKLHLWVTSGGDFKFLLPNYVRDADGVLLIYDVTNRSSLAIIDECFLILRNEMKSEQDKLPIIVVGNKADLKDTREVSGEEGIDFAKSRGASGFIECSGKTRENVEEMFYALICLMKHRSNLHKMGIMEYIRNLEGKLRNLYKEKQLIDEEKIRLEEKLGVDTPIKNMSVMFQEELTSNFLSQKRMKKDTKYIYKLEQKIRQIEKEKQKSEAEKKKLEEELELQKYEYTINEFLKLKLELSKYDKSKRTVIYIKGKRFIQCMRLFLRIPPEEISLLEEVDSIDEATEIYDKYLFNNKIVQGDRAKLIKNLEYTITPEQEFWGHCSNLQAWVEHDYDTRILRSNLAFNLLKQLTYAGDLKAKAIFKEEVASRFENGHFSTIAYLLEQEYLLFLDKDQLKTILENKIEMEEQFVENKDVLAGYGALYIRIKDYLKAKELLEKSLEIDPTSIKVLFLIGITLGNLGNFKRAFESFKQMLQRIKTKFEKIPKFLMRKFVYTELSLYGLALSITHLNDYDEIFNLYTTYLTTPKASGQIKIKILDDLIRLNKRNPKVLLTLRDNGYLRLLDDNQSRYVDNYFRDRYRKESKDNWVDPGHKEDDKGYGQKPRGNWGYGRP